MLQGTKYKVRSSRLLEPEKWFNWLNNCFYPQKKNKQLSSYQHRLLIFSSTSSLNSLSSWTQKFGLDQTILLVFHKLSALCKLNFSGGYTNKAKQAGLENKKNCNAGKVQNGHAEPFAFEKL